MTKKTIVLLPGVLILAFALYLLYWSQAEHPLSPDGVTLNLPKGGSLKQLSDELESKHLIDHALMFRVLVKALGNYGKFQAGHYRFSETVSPQDIVQTMVAGKTYTPLALEFTIPEGYTLTQVKEKLVRFGMAKGDEFDGLVRNSEFLASLGVQAKTLEGFLHPATYRFYGDGEKVSVQDVLERAVREFFSKIPIHYETDLTEKGLTFYEGLIFASLIERETQWDDEKPRVAEVIWRRLKDHSPLGIDAALIYGIEDYKGDITTQHLKDRNNPYNTRIHKGLPPTPIGAPSLVSLKAVLNPTTEGYYFYVLLPGSEKRHHFSKNLNEHNRFVQRLVKFQKTQ
ncbi:MAG: endolytic transglycosylase MltG [Deltaproteobacteria bacterium]|nr:endolytic transglycosylase MltG [Deltaproteobacteria bacterium]